MERMSGEYKSDCGCKIHVIKWSTKTKMVSVKHCPMHKAAPDLLEACKQSLVEINDACNKDEAINQSGSVGNAVRILQAAISKAEGRA